MWHFDKGNVRSAHDAGFDGEGVAVAVIDGQINPDAPGFEGADLEVRDSSYCYDAAGDKLPATSTTETAEGECLQEDGEMVGDERPYTGLGKAISDAVDDGADIISISLGGFVEATDEIAKAEAAGVAAPGIDILVQGTAGSWDEQRITSGTSLATPLVAGFLAVVEQRYAAATAGQLLQSLIRDTGGNPDHEPVWGNDMGYGAASLTAMLSVDPTTYPDVNPIFDAENPAAIPSAQNVVDAAAALRTAPTSTPTATAGDLHEKSTVSVPWLVGGGIVGILLLVCGVVLAVVLTRSSRRRGAERGSGDGRQFPARRSQHDDEPYGIGPEEARR